jgi:hypothetical protein
VSDASHFILPALDEHEAALFQLNDWLGRRVRVTAFLAPEASMSGPIGELVSSTGRYLGDGGEEDLIFNVVVGETADDAGQSELEFWASQVLRAETRPAPPDFPWHGPKLLVELEGAVMLDFWQPPDDTDSDG